MSAYEAGQVCIATVKDREGIRVMRSAETVKGALVWASSMEVGGNWWFTNDEVTDIRPLVVLDLDERLSAGGFDWPAIVRVLRAPGDSGRYTREAIADQIEQQTKPPRIPEPGWGGIVREGPGAIVRTMGANDRWIRGDRGWTNLDADGPYLNWSDWSDLFDPVLIRPGIKDES